MKRTWITTAAVTVGSLVTFWAPAAHAMPNNWGPQDIEQAPPTDPSISIADASVTEGNAGSKLLHFSVTLSKASTEQVSATVKTMAAIANPASAGSDYGQKVAIVSFAPGQKVKSFDVSVYGDTTYEKDEKLAATLSNLSNASMGKQNATGTILNDDDFPIVQPPKDDDPKPEDPKPEDPKPEAPKDTDDDKAPATGGGGTNNGGGTSTGGSGGNGATTSTIAPTGEQAAGVDGLVPTAAEQGDDLTMWLVILTAGLAAAVVLLLLLPPRRRQDA